VSAFHVSLAAGLDGGDVDLLHVIIASKARFASPPPAQRIGLARAG